MAFPAEAPGLRNQPSRQAAKPSPLLWRRRALMSTLFQIAVADADTPAARAAIGEAFARIQRLEELLSEWRAGSEISAISRAAGKRAVPVGEASWTVLSAGIDLARWSDGAFDMTWAALHGLYSFEAGKERVPTQAAIARRLPLIDWQKVSLSQNDRRAKLERAGMRLGTGGIAKGYALDQAQALLQAQGLENFALYAGGQVQVQGRRGGRPWRVGIKHPRRDDYFAVFELSSGSLSTSGDYEHFFIDVDGRRWHHILDPRTGLPARGLLSVTVLAPKGIYADALSTAAFIVGIEGIPKLFKRLPFEAHVIAVTENYQLHAYPEVPESFHLRMPVDAQGHLPHGR